MNTSTETPLFCSARRDPPRPDGATVLGGVEGVLAPLVAFGDPRHRLRAVTEGR